MKHSVAAVMRAFEDGRERSEFYRGWAAGYKAGLAHPKILATVGAQGTMARAVHDHMLAGTTAGRDVASLAREKPQLFEPFERALLAMGDESGRLETVLRELGEFHFRQYKMILKVKQWMAYPMMTSLAAIFIAPLPLIFMDKTSAYVASVIGGVLLWFTAGGVILGRLAQTYQSRPAFVRARFARTLSTCIEAGLPLGRTVMLAAESSGDAMLAAHVRRQGERALTTQSLSTTLAGAPALTPDFFGMLHVVEKSGDFGPLRRLAELYEDGFR